MTPEKIAVPQLALLISTATALNSVEPNRISYFTLANCNAIFVLYA